MKQYNVIVSSIAEDKIAEYANYIALSSGKLKIAEKWAERVYEKIRSLNVLPNRHTLAQENKFRDYEIHRQTIGNYLALYTVDEEKRLFML